MIGLPSLLLCLVQSKGAIIASHGGKSLPCLHLYIFHAYQESAHKFEKNDFLTVSKPNIRFLRFLDLVSDEHIPLFREFCLVRAC